MDLFGLTMWECAGMYNKVSYLEMYFCIAVGSLFNI